MPPKEEGRVLWHLQSCIIDNASLEGAKYSGVGGVCRVSPRAQGGHDGARAGSRGYQGQPTVKRRSDQGHKDVRTLWSPVQAAEALCVQSAGAGETMGRRGRP
eukprot:Gb_10262 [translate_table: standard]